MIRAILFDMDDTLFDSGATTRFAVKDCFNTLAPGSYDDSMFSLYDQLNRAMWKEIEFGLITREEYNRTRWKRILDAMGISGDADAFTARYKQNILTGSRLMPGARELLQALQGSFRLFVATNGPTVQQITRLEQAEIRPYFEHCFISDEMGCYKPNREYFEYCLQTIGDLMPSEVLMVGDSLYADIEGAAACGLRTCYIDLKQQGDTGKADYVIHSLTELLPLAESFA